MTLTIWNIIGIKIKDKSPRMVKFINGITKFESLENICSKCKNESIIENLHKHLWKDKEKGVV